MPSAIDAWRKKMSEKNRDKPVFVDTTPKGTLYIRRKELIPTPGSQRRCYNGCFPSSDWEEVWSDWEVLFRNVPEEDLEFWSKGETQRKYKWVPNEE